MTTSGAQATAPSPPQRGLRALGSAIDQRLQRLQADYLGGAPHARATLAKLRRAVGKPAGAVPEVWAYTIGFVPAALTWDRDEPSHAEQAAHAAMTLYALHQQAMPVPAHVRGVSFGAAVARLARGDGSREAAVTRRFMSVATAISIEEILVHVRGLITQLRGEQLGFDYARLADDLYQLLNPQYAGSVRLAWGRDFYRTGSGAEFTESNDGQDVSPEHEEEEQ
ncbi:type I-E CRISPR-associated protein Cse2/CasB [Mycolicibacterium phlei]|jgi:CRISPR system Cascade subunit CasB|uniref:type I-E CRISPR-associated protein Cse2/CasB n=1 Tax=Mycolicibacterium phlei TaxID=1771 RepID=UPI00025AF197|nr:type I-E CRISPR-associated protein Cse2/CasB [Mycolicibacterium phlei]EID14938.1 Cse2 family CRISPR-associated protein [Mycolicibacterium phlei RIVM601174]MBF4191650.1 Cse2 family CRISPR-associated protein [Mycolicibacterium phlei]